jgi:hypothetical protein
MQSWWLFKNDFSFIQVLTITWSRTGETQWRARQWFLVPLVSLQKICEPLHWPLRVSMQVMLVISVVETKSYGITIRPFKIVSKCPCKISFNNGPMVSAKIFDCQISWLKQSTKVLRQKEWRWNPWYPTIIDSCWLCVRERERERD